MSSSNTTSFKPAIVVVDLQNDFCPPNGSLAVAGGRDIAPLINDLLSLPFALKVATKDFHPQDHISFASNHPAPDNKPFESFVTITNPLNSSETEVSRLWPDHCVQGTPGSELIEELDKNKINVIIEKGQDKRVEMYSAFADPFPTTVSSSRLGKTLKDADITHVYCVGIATDYCVKYTALDSAKEGFVTYFIEDATKPVDPSAVDDVRNELQKFGVTFIQSQSEEVQKVRSLTG
ncbi:Isochorismatase hydrolase [Patellaria atrata CBS 101060]|uniref:nicotinamidase n=1 Tax=Patellaria atrata CBS 101060 TaxID=1346257 RepID=A0A9P4SFY6_9PEZI|nr:Isochorismatase hydrolase [Patellaria atrata CBS 101060]